MNSVSRFFAKRPNFEEQLGDGRMTLLVRPERDALWHCDEWRRAGVGESSEPFVGTTCFERPRWTPLKDRTLSPKRRVV